MQNIAEQINILARFCGMRDVEELTQNALKEKYGFAQADVMVLFGGSILCGGDVLAQAMKEGVAKHYVIVGGAGHTTETLRQRMHAEYPQMQTEGLPEAKVFAMYLEHRYGLMPDALECESTNCGNNITYLLELLQEKGIPYRSMILSQDASMQRRMDAGLRKFAPEGTTIINYAVYRAEVVEKNEQLVYSGDICGMWDMDRYINLLMGEIPRLADNEYGYGPKGKGFIAHVEIPEEVMEAFESLRNAFPDAVRDANPAFASTK